MGMVSIRLIRFCKVQGDEADPVEALHAARRSLNEKRVGTRVSNREFARIDVLFNVACVNAGTPATHRQASKYRRMKGLAYGHRA